MNIKVEDHINIPECLAKVEDPSFWEFSATEWWKRIKPYTPMETGTLFESVDIKGERGNGSIEYKSPQAHYLYKGELMVDPNTGSSYAQEDAKKVYTGKELHYSGKKHQLASKEWDKAAEPTQKPELIRSMQDYIDSGRLNLNE